MRRKAAGTYTPIIASMDWGVPNWKEANAYPKANDLTLREWWWQFTRRRHDYRILWQERRRDGPLFPESEWRLLAKTHLGHENLYMFFDRAPCRVQDELNLGLSLQALLNPAITYCDRIIRSEMLPTYHRSHQTGYGFLRIAQNLSPEDLRARIEKEEKLASMRQAKGLVDFTIDLNRPPDPQLQEIRKEILAIQARRVIDDTSKKKRMRIGGQKSRSSKVDPTIPAWWKREINLWPQYLRILDAKDAKLAGDETATEDKIGKVLWPDDFGDEEGQKNTGSVRRLYAQARKIRDCFPI